MELIINHLELDIYNVKQLISYVFINRLKQFYNDSSNKSRNHGRLPATL